MNVEDKTTFCDEFSKESDYTYFGGNGKENDRETSYIEFFVQNFNEQTNITTKRDHNLSFAAFLKISDAYLKPGQAPEIELFANVINGINPLSILVKGTILDIWQHSKYASSTFKKVANNKLW